MTWGARLALALFCSVFMLAFGGVGLGVGVWPLLQTARMAWAMQGWQPVSAQVLGADLATSRGSKGSITYAARVRYAYRHAGQDHESTRIGLDPGEGYDNIGDWHHDWVARLTDARAREQPVAAWVNPRQPAQAVLERRPRWALLAFRLPFALVFTTVGVVAGVMMVRALSGRLPVRSGAGGRAEAKPSGPSSGRAAPRSAAVFSQHGLGQLSTQRPGGLPLPPWPAGVRGDLESGTVHFVRRWPQGLAVVLAVVLLVWLAAALQQVSGLGGRLLHAVPLALLAALVLHLASLRWRWRWHGGQLLVDRSSWLRPHVQRWLPQDLAVLGHKSVYTSRTGNGPVVHHRCLVAQPPGRPQVRLTPALADDGVQVVAWRLHEALRRSRRAAS